MKTKMAVKRILAFILILAVAGATTELAVSAQNENATADTQEIKTDVTGTEAVLDCAESSGALTWDFFNDGSESMSWLERMSLPDYAVDLYYMLVEGTDNNGVQDVLIEDISFSEEAAFTVEYKDGRKKIFNAVEVLDTVKDVRMSSEEWSDIQDNLRCAYQAFRRDYPGVFWLNENPEVIRVCTVQEAAEGTKSYEYKVYFKLKSCDKGNKFDIRNSEYQSEEAIREDLEMQNLWIQKVLKEAEGKNAAETVSYFKRARGTAEKYMGGDKEYSSCALKVLCDLAGIPCVLASGKSGKLEAYVMLESEWCKEAEISKDEAGTVKNEEDIVSNAGEEGTDRVQNYADADRKSPDEGTEAARPALRNVKAAVSSRIAAADDKQMEVYIHDLAYDTYTKVRSIDDFFLGDKVQIPTYGSYWKDYRSFDNIRNNLVVSVDGHNTEDTYLDGNDGRFFFKRVDGNEVDPEERMSIIDSNNRINMYWEYGGVQYRYQIDGADALRVPVKAALLKVTEGTLKVIKKDNGDTVVEGLPEFSGLVFGEKLEIGTEVEIIPTDVVTPIDGRIKVMLSLKPVNVASSRYCFSESYPQWHTELFVPYDQHLEVDAGDVEVKVADGTYIYNNQEHRPLVTVKVNGQLLSEDNYEVEYIDNINAGTASVVVTSKEGSPYTWAGKAEAAFEIDKAEWPEEKRKDKAVTRYGKKGSFDLNNRGLVAPGGRIDVLNVTSVHTDIFETAPAVSNMTLEYQIMNDPALKGQTAEITIPVENADNYLDYSIIFTVTVAEKSEQDFKFVHEALRKPVGNTDVIEVTGNAENSVVTYKSLREDIVTIDENGKINAVAEGTVELTATASKTDEYDEKTAKCTLTIVPEKHTVILVEQGNIENDEYKLEIETGVSQVSKELKDNTDLELDTGDKIENCLRERIQEIEPEIKEKNIAVYDIKLMVRRDNEWEWELVEDEEFPRDGLSVMIPYPKKSDPDTDDYTAVHMFDDAVYENQPGDIEDMTKTTAKHEDGLCFTVHALSPVGVGWAEGQAADPGTDDPGAGDPGTDSPNGNDSRPGDTDSGNQGITGINKADGTSGNGGGSAGSASGSGTSGGGVSSGSGSSSGGQGALSGALTGDNSHILLYVFLFADALALIIIAGLVRKKHR